MAQTLGGNRHFERFVKTAQPTTQLPCGPHSAQRARRLGSRAARQRMGSAAAVHSASAARSSALSVWPLCPTPLSHTALVVSSSLPSAIQLPAALHSSSRYLLPLSSSLDAPPSGRLLAYLEAFALVVWPRAHTAVLAPPRALALRLPNLDLRSTHTHRARRGAARQRERGHRRTKSQAAARAYPEPQELIADRVRSPKVAFHPCLLPLHQLVEDPLVTRLAVNIRRRGWAVGTRAAGAFWAGSIRRAARVSRAVVVVPPRRRPLRVAIASAAVVVPSVVIARRRRAAVIVPVVVAAVAIALVVSRRRALVVPARANKKKAVSVIKSMQAMEREILRWHNYLRSSYLPPP